MSRWPIQTRSELVSALHEVAEIEHQLMCIYLYAVLSLKKEKDATIRFSQLEPVRRWASSLYMMARQEMEHLSLANSILTAIGERPWFARENIGKQGLQSRFFDARSLSLKSGPSSREPIDLPFDLLRFDLDTVGRLVCAESPRWDQIPDKNKPTWCFTCVQETTPSALNAQGAFTGAEDVAAFRAPPVRPRAPPARTHLAPLDTKVASTSALLDASLNTGFHAGLIEELYGSIREAIRTIPGLFTGDPAKQVQIPLEYNIYIHAITDAASTVRAIDQILAEGEGLSEMAGFRSHFQRFYDIRVELLALLSDDPSFEPSLRLIANPSAADIQLPYTRLVFEAFDRSYSTLLLMLDALYTSFVPASKEMYPHFSAALTQMSFAPAMTMLVRSLGEVLVQLDIDAEGRRAGPRFYLDPADEELLTAQAPRHLGDIEFFLRRWEELTTLLYALKGSPEAPSQVVGQVRFIYESTHRITANLREIYQAGTFPGFVVPEFQGGS